MNLVLFSGGGVRENRQLHEEFRSMITGKRNPVLSYVPSDTEDARVEFREIQRRFRPLGVRRFQLVPIDGAWSLKQERLLLSSDAIFLGGGNTYYFLKHLKARRLLGKLRSYSRKGGILLGLSAGSILMTPNVGTAAVPSRDSDENEVGVRDERAMGLVNFEFSPHYEKVKRSDQELLRYSRQLEYPIYACRDGEGIVVRDGTIRFVGKVNVFHKGLKYRIQ